MGMDGRRSFRCWLRQGGCTSGSFDRARGGAAGQRRWNRPQEGVGEKSGVGVCWLWHLEEGFQSLVCKTGID